jgi:hypothetical protein
MRITVILFFLALGIAIALALYVARRTAKRGVAPKEKIDVRQEDAPPPAEPEAPPEPREPVIVPRQAEAPIAKDETKSAVPSEANHHLLDQVELPTAGNIPVDTVQDTKEVPERVSATDEAAMLRKGESHLEVEPAAGVPAVEIEEAAEGTENQKPTHTAEDTGVGTSEPSTGGVDESSRVKVTKPRQEREYVRPEDRGGRSRETAPKNQVENKRKRRARTPKPEIVCWKREREWILAVELPEDFSENQNVTVVQDGRPLDEDDTEDGCWRLSQLHGEVVVRVLDAEKESLLKLPFDDAGCLIFKLSGGDRNRGRQVKHPGSGSCLVVVPKDWQRDEALAGAPPYEPEDVCLSGYRAHFFEL